MSTTKWGANNIDYTVITSPSGNEYILVDDGGVTKAIKVSAMGTNAPATIIQYSVDGSSSWHTPYAAGDLYMKVSVDGGSTYSDAMPFIGVPSEDFIQTQTASNSASISFSLDSTKYKSFRFELECVVPVTNSDTGLLMQVKQGGAWVSSGYSSAVFRYTYFATDKDGATGSLAGMLISGGASAPLSNISNQGGHWVIYMADAGQSSFVHRMTFIGNYECYTSSAFPLGVSGFGFPSATTAITDVRFLCSSGNISSGVFKLYGIRG